MRSRHIYKIEIYMIKALYREGKKDIWRKDTDGNRIYTK